jgi:hypothetical protein
MRWPLILRGDSLDITRQERVVDANATYDNLLHNNAAVRSCARDKLDCQNIRHEDN